MKIAQLVHGAEDLLNLARTSRTYKGNLAQMPYVWRRLRNRSFELPPPACLSFMSEIHYTALAVESVCMSCGTQVARLSGVVWALCARYCEQPECVVNRCVWRSILKLSMDISHGKLVSPHMIHTSPLKCTPTSSLALAHNTGARSLLRSVGLRRMCTHSRTANGGQFEQKNRFGSMRQMLRNWTNAI